ncbi:MAG: S-layer homology domain-containing protein, partial [Clostridia bacterium]|nr:S-layer homology domain-containing protein [Clostridia bacterium]
MKKLSFILSVIILLVSLPISAISAETFSTLPFSDVKESDWFYADVCHVWENGIMNGVPENRFAPNDTMSRAMSVTILYRMAGEVKVDGMTHP